MPTIKTIKPDGTGDYTTLSAWEAFADGEATADQWAECYTGNMGLCLIGGWVSTPDATNYPKIYAASGHEGTLTGGAYAISSGKFAAIQNTTVANMRVEGIRIEHTSSTIGTSAAGLFTQSVVTDIRISKCVLVASGTSTKSGIRFSGDTGSNLTVENCLFYNSSSGTTAASLYIDANAANTINLNHNTIVCNSSDQRGFYLVSQGSPSTLYAYNNVVVDANTADYVEVINAGGGWTYNCDYNAASDTTTSVLGGSNNQNSVVDTDIFEDTSTQDYTPKTSGVLYQGGVTGYATTSLNRQPRHDPPDIGAYEQPYRTSPILSPPTPVSLLRIFERDLRPKRYGEHRTGVNRLNVYAR